MHSKDGQDFARRDMMRNCLAFEACCMLGVRNKLLTPCWRCINLQGVRTNMFCVRAALCVLSACDTVDAGNSAQTLDQEHGIGCTYRPRALSTA